MTLEPLSTEPVMVAQTIMTREQMDTLLEMVGREAQRRSKNRKPSAEAVISVLTDIGFKLTTP